MIGDVIVYGNTAGGSTVHVGPACFNVGVNGIHLSRSLADAIRLGRRNCSSRGVPGFLDLVACLSPDHTCAVDRSLGP